MQANRKTKEGPQHASRDAQFRYINRQVKALLGTGDPVISVDAEKKELILQTIPYAGQPNAIQAMVALKRIQSERKPRP